eukprot:153129-Prymnesium_polylepis.3
MGSWTPCRSTGCGWSERWQSTGVPLTYSTADNSRPPQTAPPRVTAVQLGLLIGMFGTQAAGYGALTWSMRLGAIQAQREINNKTERVADDLLPTTQLRIAYRDSKCDATKALQGAPHLVRDAFSGEGVSAIVGTACSGAS